MNRFLEAVKNMFRIADLRNRVLFTLALLAVYRIGAPHPHAGHQPRSSGPASSIRRRDRCWASSTCSAAGNFRRLTIFALGIMPYITSSIILQLMTVVFPYLERLQKEGELGRRKITQYTRYLTILLSIGAGFFRLPLPLESQQSGGSSLVVSPLGRVL